MTSRALLLALFACTIAVPSSALAYCPGGDPYLPGYQPDFYSVKKEFGRSQLVVEAVLEKETWVNHQGAPVPITQSMEYAGTWYDLRVKRTFKGRRTDHVMLFSENSNARFEFDRRKPYLLFISEEKFDSPIDRALTIDTCGNSGLSNALLQRQLRQLDSHPAK